MTGPGEDPRLTAQARQAAIVIFVTMFIWVGAQWLGGQMGWPTGLAFLFDLAAGAAFIWALIILYRVWRARQEHEDS